MIASPNKVRLRGTLRKLSAAAGSPDDDRDRMVAAQEALDFLAMLSGIKPLFLLGRGYNDPDWIDGVLAIAKTQNLQIVEGPYWDAGIDVKALPEWYLAYVRAAFACRKAWYICRSRAVADEAADICAGVIPLTIAREARLLGYPECCVESHYARSRAYQNIWFDILGRAAQNDEAKMRRMLAEGAPLQPETGAGREGLEAAMAVKPCPYTSINMCESCAADPDSPARRLSKRYADLAKEIDRGLATALAAHSTAARR